MADKGQQTEQPTQHRLQNARREGQFPVSREFVSAIQFLFFALLITAAGGDWVATLRGMVRKTLAVAFSFEANPAAVVMLCRELLAGVVLLLAPAGAVILVVTAGMQLGVTGMGVSLKKLAPQLGRLNPASRLKELARNNIPSLVQAALLLPIFGAAIWAIARDNLERCLILPLEGVEAGAHQVGVALSALLWKAAAVFLVFGCVDLVRQRRRWRNDLKMSKQEVREEVKEQEGNPQIKARVRRLQRDMARRHMMQEIPKATAVIVNPTHYAVAIRYVVETMAAPVVVAKGRNYVALRIRQRAIEHQIPIVENPPLAQALYKSVEVGQEIPMHLYRAVAEILAYIHRLMRGRLPGQ